MNLQNNDVTWINTIVGAVGIVLAIFTLGFVWGSLLTISIVVLFFSLKYFKSSKLVEQPLKEEITQSFMIKIGDEGNQGFLPKTQRPVQAHAEKNPYVCGQALLGNSPMFYGREDELHNILGFLRNPKQSGNISIIGERRIGKSSLLNQVCQALAVEDNVITISTTTQEWEFSSQAYFFASLHQAICQKLPMSLDTNESVKSYDAFSSFIEQQAMTYRFVFFIDEFDKMLKNANFTADFFASMRSLGYNAKYNWSYVLASLKPLNEIMHHSVQESSFHNIFTSYPLGLLAKEEAVPLIQEPMQGCFANHFAQVQAEILHYTGYHPAFIQMVAAEYWSACHHTSSVTYDRIQQNLRSHFQDLWQHRTEKEQAYLLQIAKHETPTNRSILEKLRTRGLLDDENKLFSGFFAQMMLDDEFQE